MKRIILTLFSVATMFIGLSLSACNDKKTTNNNADAEEETEVGMEDEISSFITDMYENHRFMEEAFLRANCTDRMLRKLADEYDYDDGGLAFWLFRTSSQDGNGEDELKSVSHEGGDWWRYEFIDGGFEGINRIKIIIVDGKLKIDDVERVYDGAAE